MKNKRRAVISLRDTITIVCIALAVLLGILIPKLLNRNSACAVITCKDTVIAKLPLDEDGDFTFPEAEGMVFRISDGKASVEKSGCKNQICVNSPEISCEGESIVCLPNEVIVRVEGGNQQENGLDVIL